MHSLHLLVVLSILMWTKADMLESFTVCARFKITHFSYRFMTLKSRDGAGVIPNLALLNIAPSYHLCMILNALSRSAFGRGKGSASGYNKDVVRQVFWIQIMAV